MKAWFKELVQHPVNGIGDGWPQAISYLPVDSRSFNELQPRKHASPPEDVLAESEENSGLIRKQSPPPPLLLTPFPSVRDLGGPDLALERDHEGRPDERGNACPAPTRLRRPQGLEVFSTDAAPAETENDVPEQPVPSALHADPGQPAAHHSDENRRPEHFEMHDSSSLTGCCGLAPRDLA